MAYLTPATELEAVNAILKRIGEARINTLTGLIPEDAASALDHLRAVSRRFQAAGWCFNTDYAFTLTPSTDGTIPVPATTLNAVFQDTSYTLRGSKVYNNTAATYQIATSVVCDLVTFIQFDDLPQAVKDYVTAMASASFAMGEIGDANEWRIDEKDVSDARRAWLEWDAAQVRYTLSNSALLTRLKAKRNR